MKRLPRMMSCLTLCGAALLGFGLPYTGQALAQDEPAADPVPKPDPVTESWKLDFTHSKPKTIAIENNEGRVKWYWYFTYKVTNKSDQDVLFTPEIVIADDRGRITHANRGVNVKVFRAVKDLVRNPLLMSPAQIPGRMFPGEDFAREGVAVWPVSDRDVDEFAIFFGGIYGEIKPVTDPITGNPVMVPATNPRTGEPQTDIDGNPIMVPLEVRRTRKIHYKSPGTLERPQEMRADLVDETDVMR